MPLYYLLLNKLKYEKSQRTVFASLFILPAPPVFSTDDFFEYVSFKFKISNGEIKDLAWQDIVSENYKDNFLYYVYLRHTFNTRAYEATLGSKIKIWRKGIKFWICNRESQFQLAPTDRIVSVQYKVSVPFDKKKIKNEIEVDCNE